ncbi:DUF222 domain-containing protein [Nigerium massiliense]|uniref:DUF222 domain-containing protein n=1 Tax=Nigerium massiliense TaxID=1522317 RepID=UPI00058C9F2C|nr:DUF222 domain-containing protein [Nigerium massiliense]
MGIELASYADAAAGYAYALDQARAAEAAALLALLDMCDRKHVDEAAVMQGAERWVQGGADGTPRIAEFVIAEIAALAGIGLAAAASQVRDALNLRHRHPRLFQFVVTGSVRVWHALLVARDCANAGLPADACAVVDGWCAQALALQPWGRVMGRLSEWIVRADPALAAQRAADAARTRRLDVHGIHDGHCDVSGRLDASDGLALDYALESLAGTLGDGDKDARRAAAVGVLARQAIGQHTLPMGADGEPTSVVVPPRQATLVVEVRAPDAARGCVLDPVARVEGWGPLLTDHLGRLLRGCRVTVRPMVTGATVSPVDCYEVPDATRFAVEQRNPVDVFPFATTPSRRCDLDHTRPFDHQHKTGAGKTRPDNLGPLSRFTHRAKTHGGWLLEQPEPGLFAWRSPLGYRYLVTAAGTVRVTPEPRAGVPATTPAASLEARPLRRRRRPPRPTRRAPHPRPPRGITQHSRRTKSRRSRRALVRRRP